MQEHFERLSFLFSEMKVSVVLKHCAVTIRSKRSSSGTACVLTDEKENITESFCLQGDSGRRKESESL